MTPAIYRRLILGVKKTIMSLSDIIKPTSAQRIQGRGPGKNNLCILHPAAAWTSVYVWFSLLQAQPSCREGGCQDFWELQWRSNCYGNRKLTVLYQLFQQNLQWYFWWKYWMFLWVIATKWRAFGSLFNSLSVLAVNKKVCRNYVSLFVWNFSFRAPAAHSSVQRFRTPKLEDIFHLHLCTF